MSAVSKSHSCVYSPFLVALCRWHALSLFLCFLNDRLQILCFQRLIPQIWVICTRMKSANNIRRSALLGYCRKCNAHFKRITIFTLFFFNFKNWVLEEDKTNDYVFQDNLGQLIPLTRSLNVTAVNCQSRQHLLRFSFYISISLHWAKA